MELTFIGSGGAFNHEQLQSNMLLKHDGQWLLIDCGSYAGFAFEQAGLSFTDERLDAVYISHEHSDHSGGLEELAFKRYFAPVDRPTLYSAETLMDRLWEDNLGGLRSLEGKPAGLDDFFEPEPVTVNDGFEWNGVRFQTIQTIHVLDGYEVVPSFGLLFEAPDGRTVFLTTDTQFCPNQIDVFYDRADLIFHDCETADVRSGVHAHYDELCTLPEETRLKMWLYHYQANPEQSAQDDGFRGFVDKGQTFELQ